MCFYAFCDEGKIGLKFINECIFISGKKGFSRIIVDFLVENKSEKSINNIVILYPNILYGFTETDIEASVFEATEDLADKTQIQMYTMEGRTFDIQSGRIASVTEPNPDNPAEDLTFVGKLSSVTIDKAPYFEDLHYIALGEEGGIGFTPFYIIFPDPIKSKEARWIRLIFQPKKTFTTIEEEIPIKYLKDLSKKITFEIFSPSQVKQRFKERVLSFRQVHVTGKEKLLADDIDQFLLQPAFRDDTPIGYYRIKVCSEDSTFDTVNVRGSIKECESSPRNDGNLLWYEFLSNQPNKDFNLSIKISYKTMFYKLMPFISFILAVLAIVIAFK